MSLPTPTAFQHQTALDNRLDSLDDLLALVRGELREPVENAVQPRYSYVVPVHDEDESIETLFHQLCENTPHDDSYEIIFVDDGSRDRSWSIIEQLVAEHPSRVRGLKLRYNAGKATALAAGFRVSRGEIVFTLDGDLQDDPREIPRFLAKLQQGFDLVSGWKRVRHDPWHKVLPSRVFNRLLSFFGQVRLHDHNCGFKCYRGELARRLTLHGELHRMVPCLANMLGFRSAEIEIKHHPRQNGRSKYGVERFLRGFSDMLSIGFLLRYRYRPSHFFNTVASVYFLIATLLATWACFQPGSPTIAMVKMLTAAIFVGMGVAVCLAGLVCEMILRGPTRAQALATHIHRYRHCGRGNPTPSLTILTVPTIFRATMPIHATSFVPDAATTLAADAPTSLKVAVIASTYPRHEADYAVPWLRESIRHLVDRGHQVTVLAPSYEGLADHAIDGVAVKRFRYSPRRWERLTHEQGAPIASAIRGTNCSEPRTFSWAAWRPDGLPNYIPLTSCMSTGRFPMRR